MRMLNELVVLTVAASTAAGQSLWSERFAGLAPGADVTIGVGESVLFDVASADVGALVVRGELVFEDEEDAALTATRILVAGPGSRLAAGSESDPFDHALTITLTEPIGDPSTQPSMGYRVLGVADGGSLQLHGASAAKRSWTQLAADARPGDTSMSLVSPTGWRPGDRIALAPSGEDPREAERLTVTAVSADGLTVSFEPALRHKHLGRVFEYAGKTIDMRAEVGLLSRNIVIRDADDGDPKLGFHGMFMPTAGPVNLSGVELVGGGQIARAARYPIHWHRDPSLETRFGNRGWMIEAVDRSGDWIRDCSIHSSGQRGVVIHGVDAVRVESNVVFDVWDHAYVFSEDGHEKDNVFSGNLAMLVKRKSRSGGEFAFFRDDHTESNQAEHRPSGFWGRNPFNPMIGNHSAGTVEGIGFFIDSQVMGHDMKRLIQREQSKTHGVIFRDNLSHSNYREGVSGGGIPTYGPKTRGHGLMIGDYNAAFDAGFEGFQSYRNSVLGVWIEDDRHTLRDAILTDSSGGIIAFRSNIEDVVFNQKSDNDIGRGPQNLGNRKAPAGGIHLQPTGYGNHANLHGVTFINVEPAAVTQWKDPLSDGGMTTEGVALVNTGGVYQHASPDTIDGSFTDIDGSLTGRGRGAIVGGTPLAAAGASFDAGFNAYVLDGVRGCSKVDAAEPYGVLNSADIEAFVGAFHEGFALADHAEPLGVISQSDVAAFVAGFFAGCD